MNIESNLASATKELCPCGTNLTYKNCCGQYIENKAIPQTPEQLMRSRYTAYTLVNMDYIFDTMRGEALKSSSRKDSTEWAKTSKWLGLQILQTSPITSDSNDGEVEFIASYQQKNGRIDLKEHSKFERHEGRWYYVGSLSESYNLPERITPVQVVNKPGRNDPCDCGSGKKYKKCCLN